MRLAVLIKRIISNVSPCLLPCRRQALICCCTCQATRSLYFRDSPFFHPLAGILDNRLEMLSHEFWGYKSKSSHLWGKYFMPWAISPAQIPFLFSFSLHSMRVEVKGQFTGVGSPNNHTDSRDQAQVLSGLAATQLSYLVHPKLAFPINHFC